MNGTVAYRNRALMAARAPDREGHLPVNARMVGAGKTAEKTSFARLSLASMEEFARIITLLTTAVLVGAPALVAKTAKRIRVMGRNLHLAKMGEHVKEREVEQAFPGLAAAPKSTKD